MICKKHNVNGKLIISVCDSNILDKKFIENDKELDLTKDFFKGEKMEFEKIYSLMQNASSIVAVGKEIIKLLLENKVISQESVKKVDTIPHVNIFTI